MLFTFGNLVELLRRNLILRAIGIAGAAVFALNEAVTQLFPVFGVSGDVTRLVVLGCFGAAPVVALGVWVLWPDIESVPGPRAENRVARIRKAPVGATASGVATTPGARPSVAILPFEDLTTGDDDRYFADGLTEEILNAVARLEGLGVAARTSSFAFRNHAGDVRDVAEQLSVNAVLEGSVRRAGDRLRVSVLLIDGADGCQLFAETYERGIADVFEVQAEIARSVAHALRVELVESEDSRGRITRDLEAYRAYLRGSQLLAGRTPAGLIAAVGAFDEALARDPRFALAHAGRAEGLALVGDGGSRPILETLDESEAAAHRALELAPDLPEAHAVLGLVRTLAWRRDGIDACFDRAVALGPDYAEAYHWRSIHLTATGRFDEALAALSQARSLDPLSSRVQAALGGLHYYARRPVEARIELERALALEPAASFPRLLLAQVSELEGHLDEARTSLDGLCSTPGVAPPVAVAARARIEALGGIRPAARAGRDALVRRAAAGESVHFGLAAVHAVLGEYDEALEGLRRAAEAHDGWMLSVMVHPWMDPVRTDSRFSSILASMGLDPATETVAAAS